ncbi:hypothetical protein CSOJ01_13013 [Colletotrichum sojae]|uniref:Coiled-coil domain-containing protein 16 n=1 Tax=Colletotrichum sojae TaxID=2175907 RepID=A0A8H6ITE1_9PEZI|nr:hypothetical protein CSOJ01_13013 [Colletotrichum sojae]
MADVRNLLRQQRAARRIEHPHAAYSDAGKLLCTLCHEPVKSESLWEGHLRAPGHTARFKAALQAAAATNSTATAEAAPSNKRKHDSDEDMVDDEDTADTVRKKRSKTNISTPARLSAGESDRDLKDVTLTPPSLTRRTSTTPVQGVEIQIPSRPATPAHKTDGTSSSSTPLVQPVGPSPLIPRETSPTLARANAPAQQNGAAKTSGASGDVDESEWAAFEADIAATEAPFSEDAVISAPAMTAEQHAAAAKTEEEEREKRRLAAEKDLEDEKEEATRALEEEFEDMEELEARVRRLKEKREALRQQGTTAAVESKPSDTSGKENVEAKVEAREEEDNDEEEEDDDDEDDFMGFRYSA